ncbi:MAG: hypothetical protein VXY94_01230 [Planctomycetota bacterium]|nr:hypothetical protein [Planctomycetota bacterium]
MSTSMGNMPRPKPDGPRRVRNGIRLRRKEGLEDLSWPACVWRERLPIDPQGSEMGPALEYGRIGQTVKFEMGAGLVTAKVQCIEPKPYEVRIEFPTLNDASWKRVLEQAASGAIYSAKLLAGEFPELVGEPFEAAGHPLVPAAEELIITCNGERVDDRAPSRHVVLASMLLLERLDETPELALALRGMEARSFRDELQEARMLTTRGVSQAHTNPDVVQLASPVNSIESRLQDFWRPGSSIHDFRNGTLPEHVPHALLRRLGASPLEGRFPITGLLASIYDTVAEEARTIIHDAESAGHSTAPDDPGTPS